MVDKQQEIEDLKQEIEEIRKSLPAHSVLASTLLRLEELEERLEGLIGEDRDAPA
ncbi:MAG: histidine kinase [Anaerolineales bacterium]|jgi:cell division septum initiation protein DivIVA